MILQGLNGTEFGLEIVDYEFPESEVSADNTDLDWLLIHIIAKGEHLTWDVTEPCLEVVEALFLLEWFEALAEGRDEPFGGFQQADLMLNLVASSAEQVTIGVELWHYSVWRNRKRSIRSSLQYNVSRSRLKQAAQEWRTEIQKYPSRRTSPE